VVERLDSLVPRTSSVVPAGLPSVANNPTRGVTARYSLEPMLAAGEGAPAAIASSAPVFVIRDVAREVGSPQDQRISSANAIAYESSRDIIDSELLGSQDAMSLLALFVTISSFWFSADCLVDLWNIMVDG
jgi:hypothetical protein